VEQVVQTSDGDLAIEDMATPWVISLGVSGSPLAPGQVSGGSPMTRRFWRRIIAFAVMTFAMTASSLAQTDAANGGTIRVAANYHLGGSNEGQQEAIAATHDLVVLGTGWGDTGPPLHYYEVNPLIISLEYQSWFDTGPGAPDYGYISSNHEEWFYHDANGNRVTTYGTHKRSDCDPALCTTDPAFCNCRFGLDVGNPDLRDFVAQRFLDLVTTGGEWAHDRGFDGIFMDNTYPAWPYRPGKVQSGAVSATPVYSNGSTQTEDDWIRDQTGFLASMKDAVGPSKILLFNACMSNQGFPTWRPNSYSFLEYADGCTMEYWVVQGRETDATSKLNSSWQEDMDLFAGVNDRGKWSTPLMGSGVHTAGVNRYAIASALLIWTSPRSCMNFWKGTAEEAIAGRFDDTFPEALVDLGSPVDPYEIRPDGVAEREFSHGRVLVNPTSGQITIDLGEPMRTIEGDLVTTVTLASGRAEILIREGTSAPPPNVTNLVRTDVL
jgi:hypothetical protein